MEVSARSGSRWRTLLSVPLISATTPPTGPRVTLPGAIVVRPRHIMGFTLTTARTVTAPHDPLRGRP